jgi:hypothetical protein
MNNEKTQDGESPSQIPFLPGHDTTVVQGSSSVLSHVHVTQETVPTLELTPPHPPRVDTPAYRKSHDYLINTCDKPCVVCGVRKSTLNTAENRFSAKSVETHHYPIERSLLRACDPAKVHLQYPEVIDDATLEAFVDSPRNLLVLCDQCHRSPLRGIHHLLTQDFAILPFLYDGYQIVALPQNKEAAIATDDAIEKEHNHE